MNLEERMKTYESVAKTYLMRRTPVAIRIDGKAFHTFTRGMERPFDLIFREVMNKTTLELCKSVQGCVFGYTQSDEITLILKDYTNLDTTAWFDNQVQKIVSVSCSMATLYFNRIFIEVVENAFNSKTITYEQYIKYTPKYNKALFDARVFNIPKEEVVNLVYWRQQDAIRNSIQSVGQANFTAKQLHGKSVSNIKEMLLNKNIVWDDYEVYLQRGTSVIPSDEGWVIDLSMPILKGEDRDYLERLII